MPTPAGFADVSVQLSRTDISRQSYLTFGVSTSLSDPVAVAGVVAGTYAGAGGLAPVLDSGVTISGTRVSLGTAAGEDLIGVDGTQVVCTKALTSAPPNVAVLVHKQTSRGGRRGRGRMFLPWAIGSPTVGENGIIASSEVTVIQVAMNAWWTKLQVAGVGMVLLHSPGLTAAGAPNIVTNLTVDKLISTQRRRLGR